jgi:hypothetical protein
MLLVQEPESDFFLKELHRVATQEVRLWGKLWRITIGDLVGAS